MTDHDAMQLIRRLCRLGRAARQKAGIPVRTPLRELLVTVKDWDEAEVVARLQEHLLEEVNVKQLKVLITGGAHGKH